MLTDISKSTGFEIELNSYSWVIDNWGNKLDAFSPLKWLSRKKYKTSTFHWASGDPEMTALRSSPEWLKGLFSPDPFLSFAPKICKHSKNKYYLLPVPLGKCIIIARVKQYIFVCNMTLRKKLKYNMLKYNYKHGIL